MQSPINNSVKESYDQLCNCNCIALITNIATQEMYSETGHCVLITYLRTLSSSNSNTPCNLVQISLSIGGDAPSTIKEPAHQISFTS